MCVMPGRGRCSEANTSSLRWRVRCPEGGENGDARWQVWGSSCAFPPPQEMASCQSRPAVAVTPRAASATSVTLLDNASARLVQTPALHEALTAATAVARPSLSPYPQGCPYAPATLPGRTHLCPTARGLVGSQAASDGSWGLGMGAAGAPQNCWKWLGSLASKAAEGAREPSKLPAPPFLPILQAQVEGLTCSYCRPHHFHLSASNPVGCLPCFCMGVTQQCTSSSYTRHLVRAPTLPWHRGLLPASPGSSLGQGR